MYPVRPLAHSFEAMVLYGKNWLAAFIADFVSWVVASHFWYGHKQAQKSIKLMVVPYWVEARRGRSRKIWQSPNQLSCVKIHIYDKSFLKYDRPDLEQSSSWEAEFTYNRWKGLWMLNDWCSSLNLKFVTSRFLEVPPIIREKNHLSNVGLGGFFPPTCLTSTLLLWIAWIDCLGSMRHRFYSSVRESFIYGWTVMG